MNKKTQEISITSDYITLGQFLKFADIIQSGGEAKAFLSANEVVINNENDNRRGRKLYDGDKVVVLNRVYKVCKK